MAHRFDEVRSEEYQISASLLESLNPELETIYFGRRWGIL
jgi:hypothetical protein